MDLKDFNPESLQDIVNLIKKEKGEDSKEMHFFVEYTELFVAVYMSTNYEIQIKIEPTWAKPPASETEHELRQQFITLQNEYSEFMVNEVKEYLQQRDIKTILKLNDLMESLKKVKKKENK